MEIENDRKKEIAGRHFYTFFQRSKMKLNKNRGLGVDVIKCFKEKMNDIIKFSEETFVRHVEPCVNGRQLFEERSQAIKNMLNEAGAMILSSSQYIEVDVAIIYGYLMINQFEEHCSRSMLSSLIRSCAGLSVDQKEMLEYEVDEINRVYRDILNLWNPATVQLVELEGENLTQEKYARTLYDKLFYYDHG